MLLSSLNITGPLGACYGNWSKACFDIALIYIVPVVQLHAHLLMQSTVVHGKSSVWGWIRGAELWLSANMSLDENQHHYIFQPLQLAFMYCYLSIMTCCTYRYCLWIKLQSTEFCRNTEPIRSSALLLLFPCTSVDTGTHFCFSKSHADSWSSYPMSGMLILSAQNVASVAATKSWMRNVPDCSRRPIGHASWGDWRNWAIYKLPKQKLHGTRISSSIHSDTSADS